MDALVGLKATAGVQSVATGPARGCLPCHATPATATAAGVGGPQAGFLAAAGGRTTTGRRSGQARPPLGTPSSSEATRTRPRSPTTANASTNSVSYSHVARFPAETYGPAVARTLATRARPTTAAAAPSKRAAATGVENLLPSLGGGALINSC